MMSTEARASSSGGRDSVESISPYPYPPQFYPGANYQGQPQPPWFPGQIPPGASGPWPAPWGYPGPPPGWSPTSPGGKTSPHSSSVPAPSDEYTVDTMRRIYNDDDGRVEIQRVKVQRRPPEISTALFPPGTDAMSIVPAGTFPVNERRPPPRKNKLKKQMELMKSFPGQQGPHPWYPYNPCMPYQYPYPYYYGGGCMWPPGITAPPPMTPWAGSDDSERTTSRQESLATTIDSQRLESRVSAPSRNSHSSMSQRSPSPAATTHSIAPSDSVSMRGYKNENSLTVSLRGPTPPPRTKSRTTTERRMRAIMAPSDIISEAGDESSIITTSTDIVPYQKLPPKRKKRKSRALSISDRSSSLDQKDTDSLSDRSSIASEMTNDDSLKLNSELSYAFRKFEQSVDVFKTKFSVESTPVNTPPRSPSPIIVHSNDIATSTKDDVRIPSSEDNAAGEETDTYISKSDMLDDQQPSTTSFTSLPVLETAPLESLASSTTSKKTEETPPSSGKTVACDSRLEESSQNLPATVAEVSASTSQSVSDVTSTTMVITDTAAKATDVQQTLVSTSVHESSTPSIVTSTVVSSTPEIPEGTTVVPSEQVPGKESQSGAITKETNEKDSGLPSGKLEVSEMELDASSGRDSRLSSSTFFSIRPSDDPLHIDTDSTDILLPTTDATTADEGGEGTDWTASSPVVEDTESYQWVLQQPGETPDLACSTADREDERRNAWRAEVSLWRARLVVSLCRGRGLDRQDWATFHLLVHHPLTLDLKLSMLHAPRLCVANSMIGAALVRVALIHLAQYGETLLQPEASRQLGWRSIKVDPNQSWSPVKGAVEILKGLGYQEREDGVLRYPRRSATEVSVLARLTLDMLVLAEELRLYLTGTHQYPTNISDLFFPTAASSTPASSEGPHIFQDLPRPPSSAESYSFMSAQSSISLNHRPDSRASSVDDEDTETLQVSVKPAKSNSKKFKQPSSSEDEVTLREDLLNKTPAVPGISTTSTELKVKVEDKVQPPSSDTSPANRNVQTPGLTEPLPMPSLLMQSTASLDMSSLPDLQSIRSSMASLLNPQMREFDRNGSVTPVPTPVPDTEETNDNPEEHVYEEIDVIRQQVQALRASSVPVDIQPPPLPPKKKMSSGGEDDSGLSLTYPHMEWTSTSMPGSLRGGSRGARKKKRRAPMPPEFMPPDWIPYENRPQETAKDLEQEKAENKAKYGSRRSLNPFYEDIDSVKAEVKELNKAYESRRKGRSIKGEKEANPFNKDDYVVSGYVGKNPFYEDIEEDEDLDNQKSVCHSAASLPKTGGSKVCAMGSLSELQDENAILKAKRRAPKPPSTPDPSSRTATPQPPKAPSSPQPPKSPSSPQPPKHPPSVPPPEPPSSPQPPKSPSSPQPPKSPSSPQPPKSPSSPSPKQPPTTPPPRPPVLQQENMKDVHKENTTGKEKTNLVEESSKESPNKLTKPVTAEVSGNIAQQQTSDIKNQETNQTPDETDESHADKTKARNVVSKAIKVSQQKLQIQHPTIPPPPPPPKLGDDEEASPTIPADGPSDGTASQNKTQPPFDDIPYMDANELKAEVAKLAQSEVPQPQYEIPELPGKDGIPPAPPLSPTIMRQTALLLSGHRSVPFIDDSDLPPDCPPPPPPTSPPDSPPETPKASPPETPDASPSETPHVSQPATPHNSPTETPCGSSPSSPITVKEEVLEPSTESLPKVDDSDILQSAAQSEKPTKEESVNITEDIRASTSVADNESSVRGTKSIATSSSSKVQQELASEDLDTANEPPPLPPKTLISHNSSNGPQPDPYANQSFKSSVSEEKYEIPEIPKPETSEETQNKLESIEEDRKDEIDYKRQTPSAEAEPEEERYEIPEVVKETALSIGPEGMPVRVGGPAHGNRMDLESVFGPPKPPRRRRNSSLPPPRPPKSMFLEGASILKLPPRAATTIRPASASTTSSFATASAGSPTPSRTPTSLQGTPRPTLAKQKSKTRRSWPLLFCDCMYANCKNYDAIEK